MSEIVTVPSVNFRQRIEHSELTIQHYDVTAKIHSNGRVTITKPVNGSPDEIDEIDISAAVIFKIHQALKLTRKVHK